MEQTDIQIRSPKPSKSNGSTIPTWNAQYTYCNGEGGLQVLKIFDIKPSNEYFSAALKLWFDFDQEEFHTMFKAYNGITAADQKADVSLKQKPSIGQRRRPSDNMDHFTVDRTTNEVTYASDGTPDHVELAYPFTLALSIGRMIGSVTDPANDSRRMPALIKDNPPTPPSMTFGRPNGIPIRAYSLRASIPPTIRTSMLAKGSITPASSMTTIRASPIIFQQHFRRHPRIRPLIG
jgi:hypothetical protein